MMIIETLTQARHAAWDEFVHARPYGSIFHLTGWQSLLESVCRYQNCSLLARNGPEICGVLPLFLVKSAVFGKRMISVPYAVNGSVCAESESVRAELISKAVEAAKRADVRYLELRDRAGSEPEGFVTDDRYVTFHLDLSPGPSAILSAMRKSHRRSINKAMANELVLDPAYDNVDEFCAFYAKDQHRFGTPVQGRAWVKGLFETFPEYHSIARVLYQNQTIAMFMVRRFKGIVSEVIGNDSRQFRHLFPNQFMEWGLIDHACRMGYNIYDFGRSMKESGPYQFKIGWGAEPVPYYYHYYLHKQKKVMDTSQAGSERRRFAAVWSALPLPVANWLGPKVRRQFP